MRQNRITQIGISVLFVLLVLCFAILYPVDIVRADLPPLPTVTPRPPAIIHTSTPQEASRARVAVIRLRIVDTIQQPLYSVVQWQGASGNWYDVEGWRGHVMQNQTKWWVEEKDWGDGPFRWKIYSAASGTVIATSELFYLPGDPGQELIVLIQLANSQ